MNNILNNIVIYNGYPLSVVVAIGMHVFVLLGMLYFQIDNRTEVLELVQPTIIKSLFIDENPQVTNQRNLERQRLERIEQQRLAREREAQQQREAAAAEAERQAQEREREAAQQRAEEQERARQQAALLEREELERQRAEQERRDREQEQSRQQELAERQRQEELDRQRAEDNIRQQEAAIAAANAARTEFELVQSATGLIQQVVQENWSRPPSARNGMQAVLRIAMLPTGEVTDVSIVRSSNDPAFDRAAETAVYRAAPFRELQSLPIKIFNENFRSLSLTFQPEDLLN